jgi:histidyl-tRNA synthetase
VRRKLGKQFQEAEKKQIPRVLILGENEVSSSAFMLSKTLATGEQVSLTPDSNPLNCDFYAGD